MFNFIISATPDPDFNGIKIVYYKEMIDLNTIVANSSWKYIIFLKFQIFVIKVFIWIKIEVILFL